MSALALRDAGCGPSTSRNDGCSRWWVQEAPDAAPASALADTAFEVSLAGFGGAIKQLAMGFAARGGKMAQHSKLIPSIKASKCTSCGECLRKCGVDAIAMPDKAVIAISC